MKNRFCENSVNVQLETRDDLIKAESTILNCILAQVHPAVKKILLASPYKRLLTTWIKMRLRFLTEIQHGDVINISLDESNLPETHLYEALGSQTVSIGVLRHDEATDRIQPVLTNGEWKYPSLTVVAPGLTPLSNTRLSVVPFEINPAESIEIAEVSGSLPTCTDIAGGLQFDLLTRGKIIAHDCGATGLVLQTSVHSPYQSAPIKTPPQGVFISRYLRPAAHAGSSAASLVSRSSALLRATMATSI